MSGYQFAHPVRVAKGPHHPGSVITPDQAVG